VWGELPDVLEILDAESARAWALAAADALEARRAQIDELNVFPVADADTGTNLAVTVRAGAVAAASAVGGVASVLESFAHGAALAAQGSSGMITSQLLRGLAEDLAGTTVCAGGELARALQRAFSTAYASVHVPIEGTILSVARAAASAAGDRAARERSLPAVVTAALTGALAALARTPEQLAALDRAGVVDAGGQGLVVILDALACVVTGEASTLDTFRADPVAPGRFEALRELGSERFGYEVQYLLDAPAQALERLEQALGDLGDTLVVAPITAETWNVHVHVNDVGAAIEAGVVAGRPHRIRVTRFADQVAATASSPAVPAAASPFAADAAAVEVVILLPDNGLAELFDENGAVVVVVDRTSGDPQATVAALRASSARRIVLLPNDQRLALLAERAVASARDEGIEIAVVPTRSPMQGLAALAVHDPQRRGEDDVIAMAEAAAATRFAEVGVADGPGLTTIGECRAGDVLGLIDGDVVEIGRSVPEVITSVLVRLLGIGGELVTVVIGPDAPAETEAVIRDCIAQRSPLVDLVVYPGNRLRCLVMLGME
jgi:hypothetical protein